MANYSNSDLKLIWSKGKIVLGFDPNLRRKDDCGAWISWNQYGNRNTDHNEGWEVDHIKAIANGGGESLQNLRPLHWKNNARKSDGTLVCAVSAK
jgi:hypothetical protein